MTLCLVPPIGWWCSRDEGHEGPCAARKNRIWKHVEPMDPEHNNWDPVVVLTTDREIYETCWNDWLDETKKMQDLYPDQYPESTITIENCISDFVMAHSATMYPESDLD